MVVANKTVRNLEESMTKLNGYLKTSKHLALQRQELLSDQKLITFLSVSTELRR